MTPKFDKFKTGADKPLTSTAHRPDRELVSKLDGSAFWQANNINQKSSEKENSRVYMVANSPFKNNSSNRAVAGGRYSTSPAQSSAFAGSEARRNISRGHKREI